MRELIDQDFDDYGDEGIFSEKLTPVKEILEKNIIDELKRAPILTQLKMIPEIDARYDFSEMIPHLKTEEEHHAWFFAVVKSGSTMYLSHVVSQYTSQFTPLILKKLFTNCSESKELKSSLYHNLPLGLKKFLHQESFSAKEILENFKHITLDGFTITDQVNITDYIKNANMHVCHPMDGSNPNKNGLLTMTSMATLRALGNMHVTNAVSAQLSILIKNDYLKFYEQCALEHGFLGEFYRFVVTESDNIKHNLWDKSVKSLRGHIADYIHAHQEEASQWHPLIDAIVHGGCYMDDTSSYAKLEKVMDLYLQKYHRIDIKNEKIVNQLLDVKFTNLHLKVWRDQFKASPEELNLTI